MKKKRVSFGGILRGIAMIICIIVIICSSIYLIRLALESHQIKQSSRSAVDQFVSDQTSGLTNEIDGSGEATEDNTPAYSVDFASLQAASPYAIGWIQVSGIDAINYPIVQYSDDSYFLDHSWDGEYSRYGAIFLETLNASDFSDGYSLVYGHNMKDGSMFGALKKYADASFYQEHGGVITIYLPNETRSYQIFAVRYVSPDDTDTYTLWAQESADFEAALDRMKDDALYDTGISVSSQDSIVTLSTCAGDNRLVVHAKLLSSVPVS